MEKLSKAEEEALLPIIIDAAKVFLAKSSQVNMEQLHAALVAALTAFRSTLMNGGLFDQGYKAAIGVSQSVPGAINSSETVVKKTKNPTKRIVDKITVVSSLLGQAAANNITGVDPRLRSSVLNDVSTVMKLYSVFPFKKKDDEVRGGSIPMSDSSFEYNFKWLFPDDELEGGGIMDYWVPAVLALGTYGVKGLSTGEWNPLHQWGSTDNAADLSNTDTSSGLSNWPFYLTLLTTGATYAASALPKLKEYVNDVFIPTQQDVLDDPNAYKISKAWAWLKQQAARPFKEDENPNPHYKKWREKKETGEALKQMGTMLAEGIPAIAKDYALLQQKKANYYRQLAQHQAQKKLLETKVAVEEANAQMDLEEKTAEVRARNARKVFKQEAEERRVERDNEIGTIEAQRKLENYNEACKVIEAKHKEVQREQDSLIRVSYEAAMTDSEEELRKLQADAARYAGSIANAFFSIGDKVYHENYQLGKEVEMLTNQFTALSQIPTVYGKKEEVRKYFKDVKDAFEDLKRVEYATTDELGKQRWITAETEKDRTAAREIIDKLFDSDAKLSDREYKDLMVRCQDYIKKSEQGEVPAIEELATAYLPELNTNISDASYINRMQRYYGTTPQIVRQFLPVSGEIYMNENARQANSQKVTDARSIIGQMKERILSFDPLSTQIEKGKKEFHSLRKNLQKATEEIGDIRYGEKVVKEQRERKGENLATDLEEYGVFQPDIGDVLPEKDSARKLAYEYIDTYIPSLDPEKKLKEYAARYDYLAENNPYYKVIPRNKIMKFPPRPSVEYVNKTVETPRYKQIDGSYFNPVTGEYYDERLERNPKLRKTLTAEERAAALPPAPVVPSNFFDTPNMDRFLRETIPKLAKEEKVKPIKMPDMTSLLKGEHAKPISQVSSGKRGKAKLLTSIIVPAYRNNRRISTTPLQGLTAMRFGQPQTRFNIIPHTISRPSPHSVGAKPSPLITLPKTSRIKPWH